MRFSASPGGVVLSLALAATVDSRAIPAPTGPFNVGVRSHVINHLNRNDPVAPHNTSTSFLATIFYPTVSGPPGPTRQYLTAGTASYYEDVYNFTAGTLSSLTYTAIQDAPFLSEAGNDHADDITTLRPTVLFGPGGNGTPTEASAILLTDLASHGYTVIGVDHPYEQPYVQYPNGTGIEGIYFDPNDIEIFYALQSTRLEDQAALIRALPNLYPSSSSSSYPHPPPPFNTTHFGTVGFSFGGSTAVESVYSSGDPPGTHILAAINLDGTFFGPRASSNSSRADTSPTPTLLLGSEGHNATSYDTSWVTWPLWQDGSKGEHAHHNDTEHYWREVSIKGTSHLDFCDANFWNVVEPGTGLEDSVGDIGLRNSEITRVVVREFFDYALLGAGGGKNPPESLEGLSGKWPELVFP